MSQQFRSYEQSYCPHQAKFTLKHQTMITIIQILSGLAIVLALGFLLLIVSEVFSKEKTLDMQIFEDEHIDEPFINIDADVLLSKEAENTKGIPQLKEKLRQFKNRNRFYNIR